MPSEPDNQKEGIANISTPDMMDKLYKPKWWGGRDSWKFHALVILIYVVVTTPVTFWIATMKPEYAIFIGAFTNTTNIVALLYAVVIYKLYDEGKQSAIRKAREAGLKPISLEEGMSIMFQTVKGFNNWYELNKDTIKKLETKIKDTDLGGLINNADQIAKWFEKNKDSFKDVQERLEGVDISKMITRLDELMKFVEGMQARGFTKERMEKLISLFEKVDLDKAIATVESWNQSQENLRKLDAISEANKEPPKGTPPLQRMLK